MADKPGSFANADDTARALRVMTVDTTGAYVSGGGGGGGGGDASAANQVTGNATLTAIDGHVDGIETLIGATNTALATIDSHVDGLEGVTGTTADAAVITDANGTISAKLRGIVTLLATQAGYLDGLEAFVDGIEALLGTTNTKLNGGLPAALAAGGGLKIEGVAGGVSVPVTATPPVYSTVATGERAGATSEVQFNSVAAKLVMVKAASDNVGKVYIGITGVTKADGSNDTTTGFPLSPGESTPWIPISNLDLLYRICDNAGDDCIYMVLA